MRNVSFSKEDQFFMQQALQEAQAAFVMGEVPIGAVLVQEGNILVKAHNLVETRRDATAHAEMLCLQKASQVLQNWRLLKTTLYSTLEPCSMCAGAMLLARVERLIYAAPDLRHGADGSWCSLLSQRHPTHRLAVERGLLAESSAELLRRFFRKQRMEG